MCFIVKYVLLIANFIFTLAGLTLFGLGIAALVNTSDLSGVATTPLNAIAISIIVLGAIVFLVAFFGCCGSMKENRCLLITYALCLLLLAGAKIFLVVLMFKNVDNIGDLVDDWITKAFYNIEGRDTIHAIENTFLCCGTTGPNSYIGILQALPPSCCPYDASQQCVSSNAYGGCINIVTDFLVKYSDVFGGVLASVLAVEFVAILFAVMLSCSIGAKRP
ncbi:leukocyte surface antigen CD53 [Pieris rapae]|uniref:leukocyte surface antigen CD53 n=1 Tax=Pieris rapae TaxID=64459 RepID=UPI000B925C55|nr:leukocyte surface antigen CD53 [Pieris rapae]